MTDIQYRRVERADDPAVEGFVALYKRAFAEAPYFETYEDEWVRDKVWRVHVPHFIVIAESGGEVVGFGAAVPLAQAKPSIRAFVESREDRPFPLERTVYMSELAVDSNYRQRGVGRRLVAERIRLAREAEYECYLVRTATKGSRSAVLYQRMGAREAPFVQDVREEGTVSASAHRRYLWGKLDDADI